MNLFQTDLTDVSNLVAKSAETASATEPATPSAETLKQGIDQLKNFSLEDFFSSMVERLINFAIDIAIALLVFYVGKFIIKRIYHFVGAILIKRDVDNSLCTFILSFIKIVLYFILIVTVIGILGIETSSFVAIFASAGVAIGMALSGTLQNFAGGVLILLLKPYKIGDYIEAQGYAGTVREIQIFHTIITTYDNKAIIIPNGGLSTSSVNNWSREEYRRIQWEVAISYGDNVDTARKAILDLFDGDQRIITQRTETSAADNVDTATVNNPVAEKRPGLLRRMFTHRHKMAQAIERWNEAREAKINEIKPKVTQEPTVLVDALADSSVNLIVRAWVRSCDYWDVFYTYNERIYSELPRHDIHFPFPQMDVHINHTA